MVNTIKQKEQEKRGISSLKKEQFSLNKPDSDSYQTVLEKVVRDYINQLKNGKTKEPSPVSEKIGKIRVKKRVKEIRDHINLIVRNSFKYGILMKLGLPNDMSSMLKILDAIESGDTFTISKSDVRRVKSNKKLANYLEELANIGDPIAADLLKN